MAKEHSQETEENVDLILHTIETKGWRESAWKNKSMLVPLGKNERGKERHGKKIHTSSIQRIDSLTRQKTVQHFVQKIMYVTFLPESETAGKDGRRWPTVTADLSLINWAECDGGPIYVRVKLSLLPWAQFSTIAPHAPLARRETLCCGILGCPKLQEKKTPKILSLHLHI